MNDPLAQVVNSEIQRDIATLIIDRLVAELGVEMFESSPLTWIGATLDCQIQIYYAMHELAPDCLPIAKENLIKSANGR